MDLQRQYIQPNCSLVLQGLGGDDPNTLSIVTNAECRILGTKEVLSGGREFVENLIRVVSNYAQDVLSGLPHRGTNDTPESIHVSKVTDKHVHQLSCGDIVIELTTVQLFDLVDVVDQLVIDTTTLPELKIELEPLGKGYRQADESMIEKTKSPLLGVASLTVAAIAFSLIPNPPVRQPEEQPAATPTQTQPIPTTPIPTATPEAIPTPTTPIPTATPEAIPIPTATPEATPTKANPSSNNKPPAKPKAIKPPAKVPAKSTTTPKPKPTPNE